MATVKMQLERKVRNDLDGNPKDAKWVYYLDARPGEQGSVTLPLAATKSEAVVAITNHLALRHLQHLHHVGNEKCACGQGPADTAAVIVPD